MTLGERDTVEEAIRQIVVPGWPLIKLAYNAALSGRWSIEHQET
jgi:hypothetical protein